MSDGVSDMSDAVSDMSDGASDMSDGVSDMSDGASDMSDGASDMCNTASDMCNAVSDMSDLALGTAEKPKKGAFSAFLPSARAKTRLSGLASRLSARDSRCPMKTIASLAFAAIAAISTTSANAATTAADAFASLKKLAGEWRGPAMMKGMPPAHSVVRVTAGGSAVEEISFPGTKMEMISVYHMDKGSLVMTHYCMLGNQPHVKLNPRKSTATELVFDYAGGTNLNPRRDQHMHSLTLTLPSGAKGSQKLSFTGVSWKDGKPNPTCSSTMTRVR